jgi:putative tryptophan/tyrosine transport system substrate-binding protein
MRRREFIAGLGASTWPLAARAQESTRMRRVGVLMAFDETDSEEKAILSKFTEGLADVLVATTTPVTAALQHETRTIPIIFSGISDPVGAGFVASLPRPGGNITGFINLEASIAGKLLELLTEIAPRVMRVAIVFNPNTAPGGGSYYLPSFEVAARSFKVQPIVAPVHSDVEIEKVMSSLGREPGGGLVFPPDGFTTTRRVPVIQLAARNNVPSVLGNG